MEHWVVIWFCQEGRICGGRFRERGMKMERGSCGGKGEVEEKRERWREREGLGGRGFML